MKFLCVECDRPMSLLETTGPDRGSMTVVFGCPGCERRVAMLTNAMETRMVASLGVRIGGTPSRAAEPMQGLRNSLVGFSQGAPDEAEGAPGPRPDGAASSGCPFTGVVSGAMAAGESPRWTDGARARMDRIPSFVRPMVERGIEDVARRDGIGLIDEDVIARVRGEFGM